MGVRCFTAIEINDAEVLEGLVRAQRGLEGSGGDLKIVERENIHITMKFLGDVREGILERVKGVVSGMSFEPFKVTLRGVGAFPNLRRPRVVWAGVVEGAEELIQIYGELERSYEALGFRRERRRFKPHVTLARVRSGRNRGSLVGEINRLADEAFGELKVSCVRLKKSVLTPKGPIYSTLAESISF
ncbi:MAG: RNA 2',3'-cyclic phosphodiesterase [Candidatus Bathyarchaeota archaeon]